MDRCMVRIPRFAFTALVLTFAFLAPLNGTESIVGRYIGTSTIRAADTQTFEHSLRLADILLIELDEYLFYDAIEVRAQLPAAVASRSDLTIAVLLYGNLRARFETTGPVTTRGDRLHFEPFLERGNTRIRLPVLEDPRIRVAGTTRPERMPAQSAYPLAVTFLPVGKAFPEYLQNEEIRVQIIPHTREIGGIRFDVSDENGNAVDLAGLPHALRVDGAEVSVDELSRVFLQPGFRTVEFIPEGYRDVTRTAAVERGRVRGLELSLEPIPARLSVDGPRGSIVSLNGRLMTGVIGSTIEIDPGPNLLRFQIGDRSVSQEFTAESGVLYRADLNLLLSVVEEQD